MHQPKALGATPVHSRQSSLTEPSGETIDVLHVDHDSAFTDATETLLEQEHGQFVVETATNAEDGLEMIEDQPPDCVVSDYRMLGMNGPEFFEAVQRQYPDLPFILYTGEGNEDLASRAFSAGVTDYLKKRVGAEQYERLADSIREAVEARREQKRADRREELMCLTEFARDTGGFEIDVETWEILFTEGAYEILDLPADAEPTVENGLQLFHPDDREEIRRTIDSVHRTGHGASGTWRYQPQDGEEQFLEVHLRPPPNGDTTTLRGAIRDNTQRRERQRELEQTETLVQHAQDGLFLIDVADEFIIEQVNPAWEKLTGISMEAVRGQTLQELLGHERAADVSEKYHQCVQRREPVTYEEQLQIDGDQRQWQTSIAPVVLTDTVEYIAGSTRDMTNQK